MVEVLVAVTILAFGMLAIAALQATALRNSQSSLERTQAVVHTYAILDAMRANRNVAMIGGYNTGAINGAGTAVQSWICNAPAVGDLAANDRNAWFGALHGDLGDSACAAIRCTDVECIVAIRWNDERGSGGNSRQALITRSRL